MSDRVRLDDFNDIFDPLAAYSTSANGSRPQPAIVVTLDEFADTEEPGAAPLVGDPDGGILIPQNGDVMLYGDGGAGKTTLAIHLAFCAATATPWLGITIERPLRVMLIENEGPRPLFRLKLKRKRDGWDGPQVDGRILVVENPWAELRYDNPEARAMLAALVSEHAIDLLIQGPLTRSGMNEAGTLTEVREFMGLVHHVRQLADRHVTVALIHHENKGGQVSGAWEGAGDTLLHVQSQGHGRTRLYIQKARWDSERHGKTLNLLWTDGQGYDVETKPELDDNDVADLILGALSASSGLNSTQLDEACRGAAVDRIRAARDRLLQGHQIVNIVTYNGVEYVLDHCPPRKKARLYLATDPLIQQLRRDPVADASQAYDA